MTVRHEISFDLPNVTEEISITEPSSPTLIPKLTKRKSTLIRRHSTVAPSNTAFQRGQATAEDMGPVLTPTDERESGSYVNDLNSHHSVADFHQDHPTAAAASPTPHASGHYAPTSHGSATLHQTASLQHVAFAPSAPPSAPSAQSTAQPFTATQTSPTSLPNELLELIREFRVRVERAAVHVSGAGSQVVQQLHHTCNDIIRYVTNFLIQKHEEEVRYEQNKMMGWAAASHVAVDEKGRLLDVHARVDPSVLGPFLLSTLYGLLEALLFQLRCDRARIFLPDGPTTSQLRSVVTVGGGAIIPSEKTDAHGVANSVFSSGVAINIGDTSKAPPQLSNSVDDQRTGYRVRNVLSVPLVAPAEDDIGVHIDGGSKQKDPPRILGVVEFLNKNRSLAFSGGFSEADEEAAHHYAQLISNLLCWGRGCVDLCNNTSLEEGAKIQALLLGQRHYGASLRTLSVAGSKSVTRTEAHGLMKAQQKREAQLQRKNDAPIVLNHPFLIASEKLQYQRTTIVYRVACRNHRDENLATLNIDESSSGGVVQPPKSYVASEAHALIQQGGNVRELVQILEQFDTSWKDARQRCVFLEKKVEELEASLRCERGNLQSLHQLCISCGITPPPMMKMPQTANAEENAHLVGVDAQDPNKWLETRGPQMVEDGTLQSTIEAMHNRVHQRLKVAASTAGNLGRRIAATAKREMETASRALPATPQQGRHLITTSPATDAWYLKPTPPAISSSSQRVPKSSSCEAHLETLLRKLELPTHHSSSTSRHHQGGSSSTPTTQK